MTQKPLLERELSSESKKKKKKVMKDGKKTNLLNIDNTRLKKSLKSVIKVFLETQTTDLAKVQEHEFKAWDEQYLAASATKSDNDDKPSKG
jgi:hypothetical protein